MKTKIIQQTTEDFFKRGREIARLADAGKAVPESFLIGYEDYEDLVRILKQVESDAEKRRPNIR